LIKFEAFYRDLIIKTGLLESLLDLENPKIGDLIDYAKKSGYTTDFSWTEAKLDRQHLNSSNPSSRDLSFVINTAEEMIETNPLITEKGIEEYYSIKEKLKGKQKELKNSLGGLEIKQLLDITKFYEEKFPQLESILEEIKQSDPNTIKEKISGILARFPFYPGYSRHIPDFTRGINIQKIRSNELKTILNKMGCGYLEALFLYLETNKEILNYEEFTGVLTYLNQDAKKFEPDQDVRKKIEDLNKFSISKQLNFLEEKKELFKKEGVVSSEFKRILDSLNQEAKKFELDQDVREKIEGLNKFFISKQLDFLEEKKELFKAKNVAQKEDLSKFISVISDLSLRIQNFESNEELKGRISLLKEFYKEEFIRNIIMETYQGYFQRKT